MHGHSTDRMPHGRARVARVAAAVFALAGGAAMAASAPSAWYQYGHDARQANDNEHETTLTPANIATLVPVWTGSAGTVPDQLPAAGQGYLLGSSASLGLSVVSATTGAARWSDAPSTSWTTPALTSDGRILTYTYPDPATEYGVLAAVDARTGAPLWSRGLDFFFTGTWSGASVSVGGDMVVAVVKGGWTYSFDVRDGGTDNGYSVIEYTEPIDPYVSIQGKWYYVVGSDSRIVYQTNGREVNKHSPQGWYAPLGNQTAGKASTARIAGTALLVSDSAGGVYALEIATGAARWETTLPTAAGTQPGVTAATTTTAYGVSRPVGGVSDAVNALDVATGAVLWTKPLAGTVRVHSNLALAGGMVFAGTGAASCTSLSVLDRATGAAITTLPTGMPADSGAQCDLAVADGKVILHGRNAAGPTMRVLGLP